MVSPASSCALTFAPCARASSSEHVAPLSLLAARYGNIAILLASSTSNRRGLPLGTHQLFGFAPKHSSIWIVR